MDSKNFFAYRLDFLERLNKSRVNGQMLADIKIFGQYNVWLFFQTRLFYHDILLPKDRLTNVERRPTLLQLAKKYVYGSILCLFFLAAVISSRIRKTEIFVYSVDKVNSKSHDNDTRMEVIYNFLYQTKISFVEVFHSLWDKSFVLNTWRRKRFGLHLEAIDFCFLVCSKLGLVKKTFVGDGVIDISLFPLSDQVFARQLIKKYLVNIDRSVFRVKVFAWVLSFIRPKAIFAIDDARDYFELMLACRMKKIPFYAFQHGHFTKYNVAWFPSKDFTGILVEPDRLFLWSEFWKNEMFRLGTYLPESAVQIGGFSHLPQKIVQLHIPKDSPICVLVPYETYAVAGEVLSHIDAMLSCPNIHIIFKLRTDRSKEEQLSYYGLSDNYHARLEVVYGNYDETKVNVVAGTYSTYLYDVVARGKSVLLLDTSIDFGEGLVKNGLADQLYLSDQVCPVVAQASAISSHVLKSRQKILYGENPILLLSTLKLLVKELGIV